MCRLLFPGRIAYIAFLHHLTVSSISEESCLFHVVVYSWGFAEWINEYVFKTFVQV